MPEHARSKPGWCTKQTRFHPTRPDSSALRTSQHTSQRPGSLLGDLNIGLVLLGAGPPAQRIPVEPEASEMMMSVCTSEGSLNGPEERPSEGPLKAEGRPTTSEDQGKAP